MYIACPRCDWKPIATSKWTCACKHRWNEFETHGICPSCGKVWVMTQCPTDVGCGQWSDHEDWYHDEDAPTLEDYLANPQIIRNSNFSSLSSMGNNQPVLSLSAGEKET